MDYILSTLKETPINVLLWLPIAYLTYDILFPRSSVHSGSSVPTSYEEAYVWKPKTHPPATLFKKYSPITLSEFNGTKNPKILLAIDRVVYDVTAGKTFYGPDGPYGNFAGRDASRGMAKQSFDLEMLTPVDAPIDPLTDLTDSERDNMRGWSDHFTHKYMTCGELVENDQL
ncbi:cytochrome b5 [Cantharellus anzutake]|uniref:cytochrome b5 n=1 Tax=Cantharellus anzutake TaxID=1750568 RepID=UPI00190342A1|nr:cytochrome b5 [Cantharellus anzutake]KAF8331073.1 cytochrome b5 [Cantharellus anzutake]